MRAFSTLIPFGKLAVDDTMLQTLARLRARRAAAATENGIAYDCTEALLLACATQP